MESVRTVLEKVAGRHETFRIGFSGLGGFPTHGRTNVLWAGVEEGSASLSALAADVEKPLEPLGFSQDKNIKAPRDVR